MRESVVGGVYGAAHAKWGFYSLARLRRRAIVGVGIGVGGAGLQGVR